MAWDAQAEYLRGLVGVYADPAASERLTQYLLLQGQAPDGGTTCRRYGLVGSGAGKLSAPWAVIEQVFPGSMPASAQTRGDCVSHSTRTACLGTLACEIAAGQPDEVTGLREGAPDISDEARRDGVDADIAWRVAGGGGAHETVDPGLGGGDGFMRGQAGLRGDGTHEDDAPVVLGLHRAQRGT